MSSVKSGSRAALLAVFIISHVSFDEENNFITFIAQMPDLLAFCTVYGSHHSLKNYCGKNCYFLANTYLIIIKMFSDEGNSLSFSSFETEG